MNKEIQFEFDTPICCDYGANKGKLLGYAKVYGFGSYDLERNDGIYDKDYADLNILNVKITIGTGTQDSTFAYLIDKGIGGHFADTIENASYAYMEYLFTSSKQYQA